jgi:hypothetical protein
MSNHPMALFRGYASSEVPLVAAWSESFKTEDSIYRQYSQDP